MLNTIKKSYFYVINSYQYLVAISKLWVNKIQIKYNDCIHNRIHNNTDAMDTITRLEILTTRYLVLTTTFDNYLNGVFPTKPRVLVLIISRFIQYVVCV